VCYEALASFTIVPSSLTSHKWIHVLVYLFYFIFCCVGVCCVVLVYLFYFIFLIFFFCEFLLCCCVVACCVLRVVCCVLRVACCVLRVVLSERSEILRVFEGRRLQFTMVGFTTTIGGDGSRIGSSHYYGYSLFLFSSLLFPSLFSFFSH
jgi:hypothetical protein